MKKAVIIMGLSAVLVSPTVLADYEVYGKANLGLQQVETDTNGTKVSKGDLKSFASRVGIKGTQKLNDALSAIYKWEVEVDLTGSSFDNDDTVTTTGTANGNQITSTGTVNDNGGLLKARNQFLGLKGNFGTVIAGIHDTPMKQAEGKIDLFSDIVDIARVQDTYMDTQEREKDFLGYYSPKFNHMQFQLATMPGKGNDFGDAFSTALVYGDKKLKKTPFFGAIAYDSDVDHIGGSAIRLSASTKIGKKLTVGGIIEEADKGEANTDKQKRYVMSAKYKLPNKNTLKFQVANSDSAHVGSTTLFNSTDITLGLSHKLAKTTSVYGLVSSSKNAKNQPNVDETRVIIGLVHKFKL